MPHVRGPSVIGLPTPTLTAVVVHGMQPRCGTFSVGEVRVTYDRTREPRPPRPRSTPIAIAAPVVTASPVPAVPVATKPGRGNYVRTVKPKAPRHPKVDMTGMVFGRWTVLGDAPHEPKHRRVRCRCACGFEADVFANDLRRGGSKGCHSCHHNHPDTLALKREVALRRHRESSVPGRGLPSEASP